MENTARDLSYFDFEPQKETIIDLTELAYPEDWDAEFYERTLEEVEKLLAEGVEVAGNLPLTVLKGRICIK